jgi:hemerythrin superfamily protein
MATAQTTKKSSSAKTKTSSARSKSTSKAAGSRTDAIALLEKQHREVEQMFAQFEKASDDKRKLALVQKIAVALKGHTQIEEEIFYPEARRAINDEDLLNEAVVEHQAAKQLLAEIETMSPGDELYDAKVKVLSEEIEHHVEEEEKELFPKCRKSDMDLSALGKQMRERFKTLTEELSAQTPQLH